jgi:hypothetical protein
MPKNKSERGDKKEKGKAARRNVSREGTGKQKGHKSIEDFQSTVDLPGRTDSGPEPDVFGQEIPPQK